MSTLDKNKNKELEVNLEGIFETKK